MQSELYMLYREPAAAVSTLLHCYKWALDQRAVKVANDLFSLIFVSFRLVVRGEMYLNACLDR